LRKNSGIRVNIAHHAPPTEVATIKPNKDWFIAYKTPNNKKLNSVEQHIRSERKEKNLIKKKME
jgi:hypothetical protein